MSWGHSASEPDGYRPKNGTQLKNKWPLHRQLVEGGWSQRVSWGSILTAMASRSTKGFECLTSTGARG